MKLIIILLNLVFFLELSAQNKAVPFGKQKSESGITHSFLICGNKTVLLNEKSEILWQTKGYGRDGFVLENGNILVSVANVAKEISRYGKLVWSYRLSKGNKELGTCVRLENGNTLVVERGVKPQLLEVGADGRIEVRVPLKPETANAHMQTRMARKMPNGNYLVPHLLAFAVKEYKPDGTVVRTIKTDLPELGGRKERNWPFTAIRVGDGKILSNLTNGNTVICSYGQKKGDMPKVFEVTQDKKVVWEYFNPEVRAHEVHVISTNGKKEGSLK